jgi:hypothetical protein
MRGVVAMLDGPVEVLTGALEGSGLGGCTLAPRDLKRGRTGRETYFNLFLSRGGLSSRAPIAQGLFFVGRGDYIKPWIEFRYDPRVEFADGIALDLEEKGLTAKLFHLLGGLIPAGGSMMAIYGAETHPISTDTERGLKRSFPPAATPLGFYLWGTGLRWFKDWYFPEGWMEGGMKLQATRPLNDGVRSERESKAAEELEGFALGLRGRALSPLERGALGRAEDILASLKPCP